MRQRLDVSCLSAGGEGRKSPFIPAGRGSRPVLSAEPLARFQGREDAHEAPIERGRPQARRLQALLPATPAARQVRTGLGLVRRGPRVSVLAPPCPGTAPPGMAHALVPALPLHSGPGPPLTLASRVPAQPRVPGSHEPAAWPAAGSSASARGNQPPVRTQEAEERAQRGPPAEAGVTAFRFLKWCLLCKERRAGGWHLT